MYLFAVASGRPVQEEDRWPGLQEGEETPEGGQAPAGGQGGDGHGI